MAQFKRFIGLQRAVKPFRHRPRVFGAAALVFGALLILAGAGDGSTAAAADSNDSCLSCHGVPGFSTTQGGKTISLYVDPQQYSRSVHGTLDCVSCHSGTETYPHKNVQFGAQLADQVQQSCRSCHQEAADSYYYSFHGTARSLGYADAPTCASCHGTHNILPAGAAGSMVNPKNLATTCRTCHKAATPKLASGPVHVTPYNRHQSPWLWLVWKAFLLLILVDVVKDGGIILLELSRRIRHKLSERKSRSGGQLAASPTAYPGSQAGH